MASQPERRPEEGDDVDVMLNDLEAQLQASAAINKDLTAVPELKEYLKYFKYVTKTEYFCFSSFDEKKSSYDFRKFQ